MLGMTKKNRGDEKGRKRENPKAGLKPGHDILQRKTLSRSRLGCKSGGKPPHSKMFGPLRD